VCFFARRGRLHLAAWRGRSTWNILSAECFSGTYRAPMPYHTSLGRTGIRDLRRAFHVEQLEIAIVAIDCFRLIPGGNAVPGDTRSRSIEAGQLFHVKQGIKASIAQTCSTWNIPAQNRRRPRVPRETSCIPCAILVTFCALGGFWRGLLRLQIRRVGLERPPPP